MVLVLSAALGSLAGAAGKRILKGRAAPAPSRRASGPRCLQRPSFHREWLSQSGSSPFPAFAATAAQPLPGVSFLQEPLTVPGFAPRPAGERGAASRRKEAAGLFLEEVGLGGRPGGTEASDRAVLLPCRVVFASLLLYSVRPRSPAPLLRLAPLLDDWLKRDRFLFLGWSGLFLFPSAYLAASAWFFGTTFVTSFFTHGLSSSYIEGANPLAAAVSSPAGCPGHSLLLLWGREARGVEAACFPPALAPRCFSGPLQRGGVSFSLRAPSPPASASPHLDDKLSIFVQLAALHGLFSLPGFGLRQFEVSRLVLLRPYNALAFFGPLAAYGSAFLVYPAAQASWFFAPSFGVAAIFRFLVFIQGFHDWTLNPFHMAGVAGLLGGALLSAIHGATVVNTAYADGRSASTFRAFSPAQPEETYSMVTANRFWSQVFGVAFSNKRWLHFFMLLAPVLGLAASSVGLAGLAVNLRAYDFASQEVKASEDPEFETLYTKNVLLNEGIRDLAGRLYSRCSAEKRSLAGNRLP